MNSKTEYHIEPEELLDKTNYSNLPEKPLRAFFYYYLKNIPIQKNDIIKVIFTTDLSDL